MSFLDRVFFGSFRHGPPVPPLLESRPGSELFTKDFMEIPLSQKINNEVHPDPITGELDVPEVARYFLSNMHKPEMQNIFTGMMGVMEQYDRNDVSDYNFASLRPVKDAVWHFSMMGPAMFCSGSWGEPRAMYNPPMGVAEPAGILKFIKDGIANCSLGLPPSLPELMIFSPGFAPYLSILRPFLDSLPSPLRWTFETADIRAAEVVADELGHEFRGAKYLDLAEKCRSAGLLAYTKKNRAGALDAFARGTELAESALGEAGDPGQRAAAHRMIAVCLANRAGVYLVDGPGMNAKNALRDAQKAEGADPTYIKAYHRQARAHEHLGDLVKARDVMTRALQISGMENEPSLRAELRRLETM
ncbi:hypothetical protein OF83DRAFT_881799 [Amylostereum chailletii]|nr:hypothetical protein OF83DRAFT_881799 [Amylostereum chailletii]